MSQDVFNGMIIIPGLVTESDFSKSIGGADEDTKALIKAVNDTFAPSLLVELCNLGVRVRPIDQLMNSIDPIRHIQNNLAELDLLFPDLTIENTSATLLNHALMMRTISLVSPLLEQGESVIGLSGLDLTLYEANNWVYKPAFGKNWGRIITIVVDLKDERCEDDYIDCGRTSEDSLHRHYFIPAHPRKLADGTYSIEYDFSPLDL